MAVILFVTVPFFTFCALCIVAFWLIDNGYADPLLMIGLSDEELGDE